MTQLLHAHAARLMINRLNPKIEKEHLTLAQLMANAKAILQWLVLSPKQNIA